jgi:hypothetical protein
MSGQGRGSLSPAAGSKLEEAWRRQCKYSAAGMPPSLRDFAEGGRYYKADPPLKPMSGADFEKWRCRWEQEQAWKHAWEKKHAWEGEGSSSGGAPQAGDEEEAAEEGEDPLFLEAVAASKKDAADKARAEAEAEEAAAAITAVNELIAREAAATTPVVILDE